jgi:hypothetical protein
LWFVRGLYTLATYLLGYEPQLRSDIGDDYFLRAASFLQTSQFTSQNVDSEDEWLQEECGCLKCQEGGGCRIGF